MALTAIVTGTPPTPDRNNFTGQVGYEILTARAMTITHLGRAVGSTFAASHVINIWRESDNVLIGSATVLTSSPTADGWAYASCGSVSLSSGVKYCIVVEEANAGDNWKNLASFTAFSGTDITSVRSAFGNIGSYPNLGFTDNEAYAFPNLYEGAPDGQPASRRMGGIKFSGNQSLGINRW